MTFCIRLFKPCILRYRASILRLPSRPRASLASITSSPPVAPALQDAAGTRRFLRKLNHEIQNGDTRGALASYRRIIESPVGSTRVTPYLIRRLLACVRRTESRRRVALVTLRLTADMRRLSLPMDQQDYNHLILAYVELSHQEAVRSVLGEMELRGIQPNVVTYNLLLSDFARKGNIEGLRNGIARMREIGIHPDKVTYNTILAGLAANLESGATEEISLVMQRMEEDGIVPDALTYNILVKCFIRAGQTDASMRMLGRMTEEGITPDETTYRTIIAGFLRNEDVERAETHYHAMVNAGHKPPLWIYERFVEASAKQGQNELAERWYNELLHNGGQPTAKVLLAMIRLACSKRDLGRVKKWLKLSQERKIVEDDPGSFYRVAITELLNRDALTAVPAMHQLMIEHDCMVDSTLEHVWREMTRNRESATSGPALLESQPCGGLVGELIPTGKSQDTYDISPKKLKESVQDPVVVTTLSPAPTMLTDILIANRRISALAKSPTTFPQALRLFNSLPTLALAPVAATYSPILGAYARMADIHGLQEVWDRMRSSGIKPDVACYNALIQGYMRAGLVSEAIDTLHIMDSAGLSPTAITLRLRVEVALAGKQFDEVVDLVAAICRDEVTDAFKAIDVAVDGLCRDMRFTDAARCWLAAHEVSLRAKESFGARRLIKYPTTAGLVAGLLGCGDLMSALKIYRTSVLEGMSFQEDIVVQMAKGLNQISDKIADFEWVLDDAVSKRITPEHAAWRFVFNILREFDGTLGSKLVGKVIGQAPRLPTAEGAAKLLMYAYARRDAVSFSSWYDVLTAHGVVISLTVYQAIFGSHQMKWPLGFLNRCLDDVARFPGKTDETQRLLQKVFAIALECMTSAQDGAGVWKAYTHLKERDPCIPIAQRGRVISALCSAGMQMEAEQVLLDAGDKVDAGMYESLAILYARQGLPEKAESACFRIIELGRANCYTAMSRAIIEAIKFGHMETGFLLLDRTMKMGIELSESFYVDLMTELAKRGEFASVLDLVCRIVAAGVVPDVIVQNLVVKAYVEAGKPQDALSVLDQLGSVLEANTKPDTWAYNDLIAGLGKKGDVKGAKLALTSMAKAGLKPDLVTYTALLATCESIGDVEKLKQEMEKEGIDTDVVWRRTVARTYAKLGEPEKCEGVIRKGNQTMDTLDWNIILAGWKEVGEYWRCCQKYEEMEVEGKTTPDAVTFNTLLSSSLKSQQVPFPDREVDRWMASFSSHKLTPTAHTHNLLIEHAAMAGDAKLAQKRWKNMLAVGLKPTEATFINLIAAFGKADDEPALMQVLNETLRSSDLRPSMLFHHSVMKVFASSGKVDQARKWMDRMTVDGMDPDQVTWRHLVAAYITADDLSGAEKAMIEATLSVKKNRPSQSLKRPMSRASTAISPLMARLPNSPDTQLLHMLANAHCMKGNHLAAMSFLSRIAAPKVDDVTVGTAMKICLKAEWVEEAGILWDWATKGTEWVGPKVGFLTRRPRTRSADELVNEATVCCFIDLAGNVAGKGKWSGDRALGVVNVRNVWKEVLSMRDTQGERNAVEGEASTLESTPVENSSEKSALQPWRWKHWPTENMCNSYIEALMRCGDLFGSVKVFTLMDRQGYPARPTPKTIRTIMEKLMKANAPHLVSKVQTTVKTRWPDLEPVVNELLERGKR
ncbi:pentatricopeptide repeat domain-containing protein [Spizellomyces punctatus DAOM BR117]|uniref:Pentatricopeptide repeat domain-containing protein n=1 Tax=Spizellomyces punctatus (strain DAOM BR117) TaxID=645134 RepID=A0A0L0HEM9_SPIPD|nr:pentatricopeptide repeat domain-containing protein [Spizellomyces punctatus DAOM BR117]KNC99915.1 pentatricopeptide repeat domain-containing protein [Spizellomyces punctatus DAOM BR117]|eukprot:XP_016607955.1 pentatricopeptide repeat domain-containing protein [Spizellomyces punctatus DAOM BR117]